MGKMLVFWVLASSTHTYRLGGASASDLRYFCSRVKTGPHEAYTVTRHEGGRPYAQFVMTCADEGYGKWSYVVTAVLRSNHLMGPQFISEPLNPTQ